MNVAVLHIAVGDVVDANTCRSADDPPCASSRPEFPCRVRAGSAPPHGDAFRSSTPISPMVDNISARRSLSASTGGTREVTALDRGTVTHVAFRVIPWSTPAALPCCRAGLLPIVAAGARSARCLRTRRTRLPGRRTPRHRRRRSSHRLPPSWRCCADRACNPGRSDGFDDVAEQNHAWLGRERIHHRRIRIRHQYHVGLVDRLPTGDR